MREFIGLYRGKRIDNGEWVEGSLINAGSYVCILQDEEKIHPMDYPYLDSEFGIIDGKADPVAPDTIGECTGLKDKNGKLIFEGDVFKFNDEVWESYYTSCGTEYNSWEVENYGVVGFCDYSGRFDFIQYKFNDNSVEADLHENHEMEFYEFVCELEIIGNIHDNPELLKGGEGNG